MELISKLIAAFASPRKGVALSFENLASSFWKVASIRKPVAGVQKLLASACERVAFTF